jgi:hypothetical protein
MSRKQTVKIENNIYSSNLSESSSAGKVYVFDRANQTETSLPATQPSPTKPVTTYEKNNFGGVVARIFPPWNQEAIPCLPAESTWDKYDTQMTPTKDGFLFLKTFKTGSSTASGVHLRIARNIAKRRNVSTPICKSRFDHVWANKMYNQLDRQRSFLWTVVREPTSRIVSQLFHLYDKFCVVSF